MGFWGQGRLAAGVGTAWLWAVVVGQVGCTQDDFPGPLVCWNPCAHQNAGVVVRISSNDDDVLQAGAYELSITVDELCNDGPLSLDWTVSLDGPDNDFGGERIDECDGYRVLVSAQWYGDDLLVTVAVEHATDDEILRTGPASIELHLSYDGEVVAALEAEPDYVVRDDLQNPDWACGQCGTTDELQMVVPLGPRR